MNWSAWSLKFSDSNQIFEQAHRYDLIANNIQNRMNSISLPFPQFNSNKLVSIYHVIIIIIKSLHFTPAVLISISGLQQVEIFTFLVTLCRRCFGNTSCVYYYVVQLLCKSSVRLKFCCVNRNSYKVANQHHWHGNLVSGKQNGADF